MRENCKHMDVLFIKIYRQVTVFAQKIASYVKNDVFICFRDSLVFQK